MKKLVIFLILSSGVLSGCGQAASTGDIEQRINEELAIDSYVPEHPDYPIGMALIEYGFHLEDGEEVLGEPRLAAVEYQLDNELKFEGIDQEAWEEENRKEIIYGDFYQEPSVVSMQIFKDGFGSLMNAEIRSIEGHEVQYQFLEREDHDIVIIGFNIADVGYILHYHLLEDQTEEDAQNFAGDIIEYFS